MFYYLYKITNILNNKIYIGVHKTRNLDDGYMGSGAELIKDISKFGLINFKKEILEFFESSEKMFAREEEIVNSSFLLREDVYNRRVGGKGGFDFINSKEDQSWRTRAAMQATKIFNDKFANDNDYRVTYSKKRSELTRKIVNDPNNKFGKNPPGFAGKTHTDETIQKMSDAKKGKGIKENNSQFGTCWITNGTENKKIKKDEAETWLTTGWRLGRIL